MTPKDWGFARTILDTEYVDMAYLVHMKGVLASTPTINDQSGTEGNSAQHVAIVRSTDYGHTWGAPADIESPDSPESSWAVPWYDSVNDKLYCFYVYNFEDVRSVPNSNGIGSSARVDCIGKIAYRVSTDKGLTWGGRQLITLPAKDIDNRNPFAGSKQLLWLFGHAVEHAGKVYIGFSKMGQVVNGNQFVDTEAFVLRADYDSSGLSNFTQLPSTGTGIKLPVPFWTTGETKINEEPSVIVDDDGITVVLRNDRGRLGEAWSTDGAAFSTDWARETDGYRTLYHPRGPAAAFKLPDGRFFLWTYNNGDTGWGGRCPVWYRIGNRYGNRIRWGSAKAICYNSDQSIKIGYPSFVILGDELLISATDKTKARLFRFPLAEL